jgi:DNA (cytosine-5)-methyltransferase 1
MMLTAVELCAGAGGQALGFHRAGFKHLALVDLDDACCETLRHNFPRTKVIPVDLFEPFDVSRFKGVDLLTAGVPCPPFSVAGKMLGEADDRNLFPVLLRIVGDLRPKGVMIENVEGLLKPRFDAYRHQVKAELERRGHVVIMRVLNAADYGVPQRRRRTITVAMPAKAARHFSWPKANERPPPTVGQVLLPLMKADGWRQAERWARRAQVIAPTIVGGSKKHGGADLGPSGSRKAWAALGVKGSSLADHAPEPGFVGMPRLTVEMVARLQGFPDG